MAVEVRGFELAELGAIVRRHKFVMAAVVLLGVTLAWQVVSSIAPRYQASALLLLDTRRLNAVNSDPVVSGPGLTESPAAATSEVEVLSSEALARRVVQELGLDGLPEFQARPGLLGTARRGAADALLGLAGRLSPRGAAVEEPGTAEPDAAGLEAARAWLAGALRDGGEALAPTDRTAQLTPEAAREAALAGAADTYQDKLSIYKAENSYAIRLSFAGFDPVLAAKIVNTHAKAYLDQQLEAKRAATLGVQAWLDQRLVETRQALAQSERNVQEFRKDRDLLGGLEGNTVVAQQLVELNTALVATRADLAAKRAELREIEVLARDPDGAAAAGEVLASPTIQSLGEQEVEVLRRRVQVAERLLPNHPLYQEVERELGEVRDKLRLEVEKVRRSRESAVRAAGAREASLLAGLNRLADEQRKVDTAVGQLSELQTDVGTNQRLLEMFLLRYKEILAETELQYADARVVSPATPPQLPFFPRKTIFLGLAGVLSCCLGAGLSVLLDRSDKTLRTARDVEEAVGVPSLSLVPRIPSGWRGRTPEDEVVRFPASPYSEAIFGLRNLLYLRRAKERQPLLVLVTSALAGEGKSSLAVSVARGLALSGSRVMLIDCDVRRSSVLAALGDGEREAPGLGELLQGSSGLAEVAREDRLTSLRFIGAGGADRAGHSILDPDAMRVLLERLKASYDYVVLDTPPLTLVNDALLFAPMANMVLFVARWRRTHRDIVRSALRRLSAAGAETAALGLVLNAVDLSSSSHFSPSDDEYYHKDTIGHYQAGYAARQRLALSGHVTAGPGRAPAPAPGPASDDGHPTDAPWPTRTPGTVGEV